MFRKAQSLRHSLYACWFRGQQLLGHSAHYARSRFPTGPRAQDIDRLAAQFADGFYLKLESIRGAFFPPHQFNALDEQSALKVDFWLLKDDLFERNAFDHRRQVTLFGIPAWIATAEDAILHSSIGTRLRFSDRQLQDAAGVYAIQGDALDRTYLRQWAHSLDVERELDAMLAGILKPKST